MAAFAGVAVSTIISYSSSLFIEPLQHEFGWTRAQAMSGHAIASVAGVICAPFTGLLVDKIGPRRLGIAAVVSLCASTAMLGLTGSNIWGWRALWLPIAFAIVLIQPSVWTAAVTSLFDSGRGFALAVTLCGSSVAAIVIPPLTYFLIETYGWRMAWAGLAAFWAVLTLPPIWFFFSSAKDRQRLSAPAEAPATAGPPRSLWQSGLLTRRFPQLLVAGVCIAGVVVTLGVSLVPLLSSNGLTRGQAAGIASLLGLSSIAGRLAIGTLLDRMSGRFLAAFCVTLPIVGILILIQCPGSTLAASLAVLILGLSLGAELDLIAYLTSRYFKVENFGFLFGTIGGFIGLAGGNGPILLNASFDATGSYIYALWAAIPICLFSALLFLLLGPYPDRERYGSSV
ncbi:MFS transporter [Novosphingobium sp. G106]|uniref:MFS transporter n=1 Tax=Novosphingobium sp. G106 TaxID=2849500 RepID=UPI001C2D6330|nr:MFS transporter [Novosphingobium sp. G106]MBV1686184.1 MFS transporter [Novosphingobium sp. G106]